MRGRGERHQERGRIGRARKGAHRPHRHGAEVSSEPVELEITGLAHGGYGIARHEGRVWFVPRALPGERVAARAGYAARGIVWARDVQVVEASADRVEAACPAFGVCGGCAWLHFRYPAQAAWKRRIVAETFQRLGGLEIEPEWYELPEHRLGYRTRAEFHGDGHAWGFYEGGSHEVVEVMGCPLCHPAMNAALEQLRKLEPKGSVELTAHPDSGMAMAWSRAPLDGLEEAFPLQNWLGDEQERVRFLYDGVWVVNGAFSQSSFALNRMLRRVVAEYVMEVVPSGRLLDLYCGNGNLSAWLAGRYAVSGWDHHGAAVQGAADLKVGDYQPGGEGAFIEVLGKKRWDVVLLDPPRTGAKGITDGLAGSGARAIAYVSCDAATQARDAAALTRGGYRLARLAALDMFPHTPHVETVALFIREG